MTFVKIALNKTLENGFIACSEIMNENLTFMSGCYQKLSPEFPEKRSVAMCVLPLQ